LVSLSLSLFLSFSLSLFLSFSLSLFLSLVGEQEENDRKLAAPAGKGNGFPKGPHYNLNLIAYPKSAAEKDVTRNVNGKGHRIFVPSTGKAKINLLNSDEDPKCSPGAFEVINYFAAKGDAAEFCLPDPFPEDTEGETAVYAVYARALGKPGGSSTITTGACAEDADGNEYCAMGATVSLKRLKGKSTATDVSQELLTLCYEGTGYGLFDDIDFTGDGKGEEETSWFWDYENDDLKLAQLRFYYIGQESEIKGVIKGNACS
jgi:hypothetical protein